MNGPLPIEIRDNLRYNICLLFDIFEEGNCMVRMIGLMEFWYRNSSNTCRKNIHIFRNMRLSADASSYFCHTTSIICKTSPYFAAVFHIASRKPEKRLCEPCSREYFTLFCISHRKYRKPQQTKEKLLCS